MRLGDAVGFLTECSGHRSIKSAARGFRHFEHDRRRILFCLGKFNMLPEPSG